MSTFDEKRPLTDTSTTAQVDPPPVLPLYQDISPGKYPVTGYPTVSTVTAQPTYIVYQPNTVNYAAKYSRPLITLFILSSVACCFCWPLALVAFCFTIAAFVVASTNENPKGLMIAALAVVIAAFVIGVPLTIWYIIYRANGGDDDDDDHDDN